MATRPAIFKWRQTEPVLILTAVRWYLRYSLSLRDVEELLKERGLEVDHTTVWHWVQRCGPELEERLRLTPPLSAPTGAILEQHSRAKPPSDQTPVERQVGVPRIPGGAATIQGYDAIHMIRKGQA